MSAHRIVVSFLLVTALGLLGCATNAGIPRGRDGSRLEFIGEHHRILAPEDTITLEIQYTKEDGTPWVGVDIAFYLDGVSAGSRVGRRVVRTDNDGIAATELHTGQDEATFDVLAEADGLTDSVLIEVSDFEVEFTVRDRGVGYAESAQVGLFIGSNCAVLTDAARVPMPEMHQMVSVGSRGAFRRIVAERSEEIAILAVGLDNYRNAVSEGCADIRSDSRDDRPHVEITLSDIGEQFGGEYDLETKLDLTSGLDPSISLLLAVTAGLGSSPADFLLDIVSEDTGTPGWLIDALTTTVTRTLVESYLRDALDGVVDWSYITAVGDAGYDLHRVLTQMTLDGELSFAEPNEFGEARGQHRVLKIKLPLVDRTEERNVSASAMLDVYVDSRANEISLGEHTLRINLGPVVRDVWRNVVLDRLPGSPRSSIEFVQKSFDCGRILARLEVLDPEDDLVNRAIDGACEIGVTLLATMIEDAIARLGEYDQLTLWADGDLLDTDADSDRDVITHSEVTAKWVAPPGPEGEREILCGGEMEGQRHDDRIGRDHPMIVRINGVR